MEKKGKAIHGMFLLIDRKNDAGMTRWIEELSRREMPALVLADGHTLHTNPALIKKIARQASIDMGIGYNDGPLWEEMHEKMIALIPKWMDIEAPQLLSRRDVLRLIMQNLNNKFSSLAGKTTPVFGGKYFSYSEEILEIAEEIGIQFILARGTEKEKAVFYQPKEYAPVIISVSNVPSKELGTGSLCDISLKNRNEKPSYFRDLLFSLNVDRFILVAQTHISGIEDEWWDVYQEFFNSNLVQWHNLKDFVVDPKVLPYKQIPINREASYMASDLEKAEESG